MSRDVIKNATSVTSPKRILNSMPLKVGFTMLYDFGASTIKRYQNNTVVKTGEKDRRESEAAALRLSEQLALPTPRVHEVVESNTDGKIETSIRMDFIRGQTLESLWPTLSADEKRDYCHQLRGILDKMRGATWPGTTIGACDGGPVLDARKYTVKTGGPFTNEADLNDFILDLHDMTPEPMRETLAKHQRTDHRIVFSHGDLHQGNIMVEDGRIIGLIDWEMAGWYPEYWDYVKFCCSSPAHRDWYDYANEIFSETYDDALLFQLALQYFQRG